MVFNEEGFKTMFRYFWTDESKQRANKQLILYEIEKSQTEAKIWIISSTQKTGKNLTH